jgi:hypothetical protein
MTYRYVIVETLYKYEVWDSHTGFMAALISERRDALKHCAQLNNISLSIDKLKYEDFCAVPNKR